MDDADGRERKGPTREHQIMTSIASHSLSMRSMSLLSVLFVCSCAASCSSAGGVLGGVGAVGSVVSAVHRANTDERKADSEEIRSRAEWEQMNLKRHEAGLAPLPYPGEELTPEEREAGRRQWNSMNVRLIEEGRDPFPMPPEYLAEPRVAGR